MLPADVRILAGSGNLHPPGFPDSSVRTCDAEPIGMCAFGCRVRHFAFRIMPLDGPPMLNDIASLEEAKGLLAAFSPSSMVGFGICDPQLRYLWINRTLAASNGASIETHLGNTVRDILGEIALTVEPLLQRVLATGDVVSKEIEGEVPTRQCLVHWITSYFPLRVSGTRVLHMGGIAIEVTELKRLDRFFRRLRYDLARRGDNASLRVAQELSDSLDQYFAALTTSMGKLRRNIWQLDQSVDKQFSPTMELLEKRLLEMRTLASCLDDLMPLS